MSETLLPVRVWVLGKQNLQWRTTFSFARDGVFGPENGDTVYFEVSNTQTEGPFTIIRENSGEWSLEDTHGTFHGYVSVATGYQGHNDRGWMVVTVSKRNPYWM